MNDRIRELAREAGLLTYNPENRKTKLDKFAELIVAEMLQTCEEHPGWTGRMIGEEIKQHFGVEE
jgi:transposase